MAIAHLLPVPDLAIVQAQKKLTQKQDELKTLRTSLLEAGTSTTSDDIIQCLTEDILHLQERQNSLSPKFDEIQAAIDAFIKKLCILVLRYGGRMCIALFLGKACRT